MNATPGGGPSGTGRRQHVSQGDDRPRGGARRAFLPEAGAFFGPNGSGKNTYAHLDRSPYLVGAALGASSFRPYRSGRDHLRVCCAANRYPDTRAARALAVPAHLRQVRGWS